ncbi:MAG TPA: hypothetical protein PLV83_05070 [Bacilli bacterium]|nr:hypothetical protein [Bacilli bacterium]
MSLFIYFIVVAINDILNNKKKKNKSATNVMCIIGLVLFLLVSSLYSYEIIYDLITGPSDAYVYKATVVNRRGVGKYKVTRGYLKYTTPNNVNKSIKIRNNKVRDKIVDALKKRKVIKIYYHDKLNEIYDFEILEKQE